MPDWTPWELFLLSVFVLPVLAIGAVAVIVWIADRHDRKMRNRMDDILSNKSEKGRT